MAMQVSLAHVNLRPSYKRPLSWRAPCRCRGLIQRRPWRPVIVQAKGRHQHAGDSQSSQNASTEMVPEYSSASHQQQPEAYQQHYSVPQYPGPPPQYDRRGSSGGGGLPTVVWVLVGAGIATVVSKVYGVVRSPGGVQGWMMQQAMKQAMKGMGGQPGQPGQAPNPFGGMAGMPGGMPGGMPPGFPGMPGQMGKGWPPAVDTTAQPTGTQQAGADSHQPPYNQDFNKGKRFQEHKAQTAKKAGTTEASPRSTASSAPAASTPPPSSFVDAPKQAASFRDVGDEESSSSAASSSQSGGAATAQPGFVDANQSSGPAFGGFGQQQQQQQQQQQASSSGTGAKGGKGAVDVMEKMLKDPNMQKLLYPYLPEGMRNPETFDWMMNNPEYRAQLEEMLSKQGTFDDRMLSSLQGDAQAGNWEEQLKQMNMTPEDVIGKIMSEPTLATAFAKQEVQAAIMDCTQNPMNIINYQNNPEIMMVFTKMQELFPQGPPGQDAGMPNAGMPNAGQQ